MLESRYKPLFSKSVYKMYEAEGDTEEDKVDFSDLDLGGEAEAPPEQQPQQPAPTDTVTPDTTAPTAEPVPVDTEQEQTDEEKEAEDQKEAELNARVSNIFSEIADRLGPETMRYYKEVSDEAIKYINEIEMPEEDKKELIRQFPEIGLKIISASNKNNFINRDNIVYAAIIEGTVDISSKIGNKEKIEKKEEE